MVNRGANDGQAEARSSGRFYQEAGQNAGAESQQTGPERGWEEVADRYRIVIILAFLALPITALAGYLLGLILL